MKADDVPPPAVIAAHVRTAVDGAVRWLDRALSAEGGDINGWDHSCFYARLILMRGLERGELLGWSLDRERATTADPTRVEATRACSSYWGEAREGLDGALKQLRRLADASPTLARPEVLAAREQITQSSEWLTSIAEGLARTGSRTVDLDDRPPQRERAFGFDLEAG
jgi:hypothetical protein